MPLPVLISFASIGAFAGSVVGQLLIGTALSALGSALAKQNKPESPGIRTEVTTEGSVTPQTFILGRYATAGNLVSPQYATGTPQGIPNGYRVSVMDVSDVPITAWNAIWVDGDKYPVANLVQDAHSDGITYLRPASGDFQDALRIVLYDGNQTAADPYMLREFAGHSERPWQTDMIGRGVAYAMLNFRFDPELYQGEPSLLFEVDGVKLYDPRKDSTNGGTGAHRWSNSATWEFTENPAVMVYNLLRGITLPDGGVYGLGVENDDLPADWWHVAMDKCDEIVGSNPRYRAGYEVKMATAEDGGDAPLDVIDELLKAMDAELCDLGGTWIIRAGAPLAAVATITDDDILRSSPQDLDPFKGLADTYNAVRASHPLPSSMWQATEAPPRYDTAAEAEDGQRLVADIDLPAVPYKVQVQRLMRAWLKDARRMRQHTIVLPPQYSYLTPLDTIEWSSDRNGYVTKLFEIGDVEIDAMSLSVRVTLRERNPADYDWQPTDELPTEAPSQVIVPYTRVPLPGFQVQAVAIKDTGGTSRRAGIEMTWPGDLSADMRTIAWQIRLLSTGEKVNIGSMSDVAEGRVIVSENILPETTYEVRARGLRERTEWSAWITVTTLAAEYLAGDEAKRLKIAGQEAREAGREAADLARELLRSTVEGYEESRNIRQDMAIVDRQTLTRVIAGEEALAYAEEYLGARINDNIATIEAEKVARADADSALASDVTTLTATVNGHTGSIEQNATTIATLEGTVTSSYLLRARAGGATGEMEVVAGSDPNGASSLVRFSADRFLFEDGVAMFGGALQSDDFIAGSQGWRIRANGNVEFNNLIARGDIKAAAVDTDQLETEAATIPVRTFAQPDVSISTTTWTTIAELTIDRKGYATDLFISFSMDPATLTAKARAEIGIFRGNETESFRYAEDVADGGQTQVSFGAVDFDTGTGPTTYKVKTRKTPTGDNNYTVRRMYFSATQYKR